MGPSPPTSKKSHVAGHVNSWWVWPKVSWRFRKYSSDFLVLRIYNCFVFSSSNFTLKMYKYISNKYVYIITRYIFAIYLINKLRDGFKEQLECRRKELMWTSRWTDWGLQKVDALVPRCRLPRVWFPAVVHPGSSYVAASGIYSTPCPVLILPEVLLAVCSPGPIVSSALTVLTPQLPSELCNSLLSFVAGLSLRKLS